MFTGLDGVFHIIFENIIRFFYGFVRLFHIEGPVYDKVSWSLLILRKGYLILEFYCIYTLAYAFMGRQQIYAG